MPDRIRSRPRQCADHRAASTRSEASQEARRGRGTGPAQEVNIEAIAGTNLAPTNLAELIIPLIMCGGAGTRLWPASREGRPKQFLRLFGQYSTFQETMRRVADPTLYARPIVITHHQYRFQIAERLGEINLEADILLEPLRRDSAPAIAAGSAFAHARGDDTIVLALAADHVVRDVEAFADVCRLARATA